MKEGIVMVACCKNSELFYRTIAILDFAWKPEHSNLKWVNEVS